MNTNKQRYEKFLAIVREQEMFWNPHPDDDIKVAAFLLARARAKKILYGTICKADEQLLRDCENTLMDRALDNSPLPAEDTDNVA